jgi:membrane protein implicated in regulation of membrane protease activity
MSSSTAGASAGRKPRTMWSVVVLAKYSALQLPTIALVIVVLLGVREWLALTEWMVWTVVGLWVAFDVILYPFVWRSYLPNDPAALPYPTGSAIGVAIERIDPTGHVRVWGELWRAELARGARCIEPGQTVRIKARRGLTLMVEAERSR